LVAKHGSNAQIALYRDDTKLQAYRVNKSKPSIEIYSSAGKNLHTIAWDKGSIKGLGWSEDERLLVITSDGIVRCYDLQGEFTQFSLGHGAEDYGVVSCK
jgi:vacuolar protein sorting-associated protein 16